MKKRFCCKAARIMVLVAMLVGLFILVALAWAVPGLEASPAAGLSGVESMPQSPGAVTAGTYFDSGWKHVTRGTCKTFNHNLGGDPDD